MNVDNLLPNKTARSRRNARMTSCTTRFMGSFIRIGNWTEYCRTSLMLAMSSLTRPTKSEELRSEFVVMKAMLKDWSKAASVENSEKDSADCAMACLARMSFLAFCKKLKVGMISDLCSDKSVKIDVRQRCSV